MRYSYRAVQVSDLPEYVKHIECEVYLTPSMDFYQDFYVNGHFSGNHFPRPLTWKQIKSINPSSTVYVKA